MFRRMIDLLMWQLVKRCEHEWRDVSADILEGKCIDDLAVEWCRRCGSYRFRLTLKSYKEDLTEWRNPRADWTGEHR